MSYVRFVWRASFFASQIITLIRTSVIAKVWVETSENVVAQNEYCNNYEFFYILFMIEKFSEGFLIY